MEHLTDWVRNLSWCLAAASTVLSLTACGSGGSIDFYAGTRPTSNKGAAATTMVPASLPLAIESGKSTANGYHAKLQFNSVKGTELTGGGYSLKLKHTVRNR